MTSGFVTGSPEIPGFDSPGFKSGSQDPVSRVLLLFESSEGFLLGNRMSSIRNEEFARLPAVP